jgi:hypothetical protein
MVIWDGTLLSNYTVTLIPKYLDGASHPRKWPFWSTFQNTVVFWNVTLVSNYHMMLILKYIDAASWTYSGVKLHRDAASHYIRVLKSFNNFLINLKTRIIILYVDFTGKNVKSK